MDEAKIFLKLFFIRQSSLMKKKILPSQFIWEILGSKVAKKFNKIYF